MILTKSQAAAVAEQLVGLQCDVDLKVTILGDRQAPGALRTCIADHWATGYYTIGRNGAVESIKPIEVTHAGEKRNADPEAALEHYSEQLAQAQLEIA